MAEFKFRCPYCGQKLEADEEWSGMESGCPRCGRTFAIPAPPAAEVRQPPQLRTQPGLRWCTPPRNTPPPREHYRDSPPPQQNYQTSAYPGASAYSAKCDTCCLYNPTATVVWAFLIPLLAFWFLKRNYEELGDLAKSKGCLVCFCIGIGFSVLCGISQFSNTPALDSGLQYTGIGFTYAAIIESRKFVSALKRDYCDCDINYRSTWPAGLLAIVILGTMAAGVIMASLT